MFDQKSKKKESSKRQLKPKPLDLTYQDFKRRKNSIEHMKIDKYVVYNQIGLGTYGSVYRGMDDITKNQVAIKVIDMTNIKNEANKIVRQIKLRLAESEPRLMYICDSENLLKCYDVYENEDLKLIVIQYCNGETLQAEINRRGRIPENQACKILKHAINGLMEMHSHNIVHRDLKADNIMSHNGKYKIIDFGFSKKLTIAQLNGQVKSTSLGTITTMAPEVMGRKPYGLKADIWSLGIIFFQMIYGTQPYTSLTAATMYRQIQTRKLFSQSQVFTLNKFAPSREAYQFLRFMIVVQAEKRPDWKAVIEHPWINRAAEMMQSFIQEVDIDQGNKLDCNAVITEEDALNTIKNNQEEEPSREQSHYSLLDTNETPVSTNIIEIRNNETRDQTIEIKIENQQQKIQTKTQMIIQTKPLNKLVSGDAKKFENLFQLAMLKEQQAIRQRQTAQKIQQQQIVQPKKKKNIQQLTKQQIQQKLKQQNISQQDQHNITQDIHLQCLKTTLIYHDILQPLEQAHVFEQNDRDLVQFIYLLVVRCFNNMSPLQDLIGQRQRKKQTAILLNSLKRQIQPIYTKVHSKFKTISKALTKIEDMTKSKITDGFSKFASFLGVSSQYVKRDKFFTGIQNIDYSKSDQIEYTIQYYKQNIHKKLKKHGSCNKIVKRMEKYQRIMNIKRTELKSRKMAFQVMVRDILDS